ncbi:MAG: peptide chain release factor N(5)-glutamine methyltransferase [Janthinobacterium lividum]
MAAITLGEALRLGIARLAAAGLDSPALDARLLMGHVLGLDQAGLLRDRGRVIDPAPFEQALARRLRHEPVALILGHQGFWSLDFAVSADTLIPRADSETLVEAALAARPRLDRVLDLGTGTGCLLLAVLSERPGAFGIGVDRVPAAASLAARNARALGLANRSAMLCADWAAPLRGTFDLVLSNPPYIPAAKVAGLMPDVARYEPRSALDGGADGLSAYRLLLGMLPRLLAPGGLAVFELGAGQADDIGRLAETHGFRTALRPDLGGVPRALLLEKGVGTNRRPD